MENDQISVHSISPTFQSNKTKYINHTRLQGATYQIDQPETI
jgi:hypothetical protein